MKRLAIAALILGSLMACTKSNIQYGPTGEISLQPVAEKATKAALSGTAYTDGAPAFNVWAWWAGVEPGSSIEDVLDSDDIASYIDKGEFVHRGNGSWGGSTPYYWPSEGSLVFAGYSPSQPLGGTFSYNEGAREFIVEDYVQSNNITETVDLMWFDITDRSYNSNRNKVNDQDVNGVPVIFHHALSWLQFSFKLQEEDPQIPQNWLITDIKLTGIESQADFNSTGSPKWTGQEVTQEFHIWNGSHLVAEEGKILESAPNGIVVIPQSCADGEANIVITYNLKKYIGGEDDWLRAQTVTLPLETGIDGSTWLPGKKYIYTIVFGENEIRIAPAIEKDWDNQNLDIEVQ